MRCGTSRRRWRLACCSGRNGDLMPDWIPMLVHRGSPFAASDKAAAQAIADRLYGKRCIAVRSAVSVKISDEDDAARARDRRIAEERDW